MAKSSRQTPPVRKPAVGLIMGSQSDWATMRHAAETLEALGVPLRGPHHLRPPHAQAHDGLRHGRQGRGLKVIVAGAGGAAHLPGMTAALTPLPVLGVPVESAALKGQDSLLSIVQMPAGIPVGTLAIGRAGAVNAAPCWPPASLVLAMPRSWPRVERWRASPDRAPWPARRRTTPAVLTASR